MVEWWQLTTLVIEKFNFEVVFDFKGFFCQPSRLKSWNFTLQPQGLYHNPILNERFRTQVDFILNSLRQRAQFLDLFGNVCFRASLKRAQRFSSRLVRQLVVYRVRLSDGAISACISLVVPRNHVSRSCTFQEDAPRNHVLSKRS